ncbi:MAG: class I SAM-dependent methyltransferase [Gemmataceae bacterium]
MSRSTSVVPADFHLADVVATVPTPAISLREQASAALTRLAKIITLNEQAAELLVWLLDIAHSPLAKLSFITKKSIRRRLTDFIGNLWLTGPGNDTASAKTGKKRIRLDSIPIVAEPIAGCPALLSLASVAQPDAIPGDHLATPLLALIDEEWQRAVARFSVRFGERWSVTEEDFSAFKAAADAFTERLATFSGLIFTHGMASVSALLAAVRPYVPVETGLTLDLLRGDCAEGRMLAMAYREAPVVIATSRLVLDGLKSMDLRHLHYIALDCSDIPQEKIALQLDAVRAQVFDSGPAHFSGFDSLCQKRMELPYEAASVEDYDSKYHGGVAYQIMDQKLVDIVAQSLARLQVKNPRILDLGCGPGSLVNHLRQVPGAQLTGVDLVPEMIRAAQERYPDVNFLVDDAESLSFPDESFDLVLCSGMLHHLPTLDMAMHEILRVLKPNGLFVAREPNEDNFSSRQPQLAYAHLCMRHFLFHARGIKPIIEPEAHKYHKSFTFGGLVEEMGRYSYVERFHTDLMVSYFYDEVMTDAADTARLARLDDTLTGQPGLNVVVVARKCDRIGIDQAVEKAVDRTKQLNAVARNHFEALLEFAEELFERHPTDFSPDVSVIEGSQSDCLVKAAGKGQRVLLASDDKGLGQKLVGQLHKRLAQDQAPEKHAGPRIALWGGKMNGQDLGKSYDVGLVVVRKTMTAEELRQIINSVCDYGLVLLELLPGATVSPILSAESQYFATLPVPACAEKAPGFRLRALVSKLRHTQRDFYKALSVALNFELSRTLEQYRDPLAQILFACDDIEVRYSHQFSRNHQMNQNMSFDSVLNRALAPEKR